MINNKNNTLSRVADDWLLSKISQLKLSSVSKYTNILNRYIKPKFGEQNIGTISRESIIMFIRSLLAKGGVKSMGLSPKTVGGIISVLKCIFDYATIEKNLNVANINGITVKQSKRPIRILSLSEQHALNRYLYNNLNPCNLGILLSLYAGLRIGEVCALKWEDLCVKEQYIFVHKSMQRIQVKSDSKKKTQVIIQAPKSESSIRKIPIPSELLQIIILNRKPNDTFVLTGLNSKYIEPRCLENRFKAVMMSCNIERINYHALRHTFATRCIELGFDIKSLSEILGHSNVNITLNRYVHPSMELKQKNMDMLSSIILN